MRGLEGDTGEPEPKRAPVEAATSDQTKLIEERLKMYQEAHSNAKAHSETSKAKRLDRGIKVMQKSYGERS